MAKESAVKKYMGNTTPCPTFQYISRVASIAHLEMDSVLQLYIGN